MSRGLTWLVVVVGIVLVLAATALIGRRDEEGETVPAGKWAQSVCGAVGVWRGQMEAMVEDIRTPSASSVAGEEPQSETPQGRTGLVRQGLERAVLATDDLVEGVANAGVPDTAGGEQAASQVSAWANGAQNDLEQAQDSLDEEAETLEEAIDQVAGAVRAIGTTLATGVQAIADAARDDPELADALEQSSTCQQLREEAGES